MGFAIFNKLFSMNLCLTSRKTSERHNVDHKDSFIRLINIWNTHKITDILYCFIPNNNNKHSVTLVEKNELFVPFFRK